MESGTPFHLPMQLQPSTQSCRVICVRDGNARRTASENCAGVSTRPPTLSRKQRNCFCQCLIFIVTRIGRAVDTEIRGNVRFGIFRREGHRASDRLLRHASQIFGAFKDVDEFGFCDRLSSQPPRDKAARPPAARSRKPRRPISLGVLTIFSEIVPARDHRTQIIEHAR